MNDERLQGEGQRLAAAWVRELPEETPNLAWRAALNERVRAQAERRARTRWRWVVARPALGLATAAVLAFVLFVPRPAPVKAPPAVGRLEAGLVALHDESIRTDDIVGSGLRPSEESPSLSAQGMDPLDDLDAGVL